MPHDTPPAKALRFRSVFISHSSSDKHVALEFVKKMEAHGCKCWISCRDIPPGAEWDYEVIQALKAAEAIILLLTTSANKSKHVLNEVKSARTADKPIICIRLDGTKASDQLKFWISTQNYLDAAANIQSLETLVQPILEGSSILHPLTKSPWKPIALIAIAVALAIAGWSVWRTRSAPDLAPAIPIQTPALSPGSTAGAPPQASMPAPAPPPVPTPAPEPVAQANASAVLPKIELLTPDGKQPLAGQTVDVVRLPDEMDPSTGTAWEFKKNGVHVLFKLKSSLPSPPNAYNIEVLYNAREVSDYTQPQEKTVYVDSAAATAPPWSPVSRVTHSGSPFSYFGQYVYGPAIGSDAVDVFIPLYTGKHGFIPEGLLPVHVVISAVAKAGEAVGATLAQTNFTVNVPQAWSMDPNLMRLRMLNGEGTAPIDAAPVPAKRLQAGVPNSAQFFTLLLGGDTAVHGPVVLHFYLLHARYHDEPALDGKELVVDRTTGFKKARIPEGEFIEIVSGDDWVKPDYTVQPNEKHAKNPSNFNFGAQGNLPIGEHQIGLTLTKAGNVIYRSKFKISVGD